jgi:hypothetical protein
MRIRQRPHDELHHTAEREVSPTISGIPYLSLKPHFDMLRTQQDRDAALAPSGVNNEAIPTIS